MLANKDRAEVSILQHLCGATDAFIILGIQGVHGDHLGLGAVVQVFLAEEEDTLSNK